MLLVCKMVHGSLSRAVHGICIVLSWSSPAGAKLSMLVLLYLQALCHLPCGPRWPYDVRLPISKELVFSPHGEEMRSHSGVAAQRAPPLEWPMVSVIHDTCCSIYEAGRHGDAGEDLVGRAVALQRHRAVWRLAG
jgi:hypothetical protein